MKSRRYQRLRANASFMQDGKCFYCDAQMGLPYHIVRSGFAVTLDHIVPVSRGGKRYCRGNVVAACYTCNQKKGEMTGEEFIRSLELARIIKGRHGGAVKIWRGQGEFVTHTIHVQRTAPL